MRGMKSSHFWSWGIFINRYLSKALSLAILTLLICGHTKTFFVNRKGKNPPGLATTFELIYPDNFPISFCWGFFWELAGSLFHAILKSGIQLPPTMIMERKEALFTHPQSFPLSHDLPPSMKSPWLQIPVSKHTFLLCQTKVPGATTASKEMLGQPDIAHRIICCHSFPFPAH